MRISGLHTEGTSGWQQLRKRTFGPRFSSSNAGDDNPLQAYVWGWKKLYMLPSLPIAAG